MSQPWSPQTFAELRAKLFSRAATDADFRQLCLTDPRAAVREISGMEPPANLPLRFKESEPYTFSLPPFLGVRELSDVEMEQVSGGAQTNICTNMNPDPSSHCNCTSGCTVVPAYCH